MTQDCLPLLNERSQASRLPTSTSKDICSNALPVRMHIERIGAELDVGVPCNRSVRSNVHLLESTRLIPRGEDATSDQMRQVDFSR